MAYKSARAAPGSLSAKRQRPRPYLLPAVAAAVGRSTECWLCLLTDDPERVAQAALEWSPRIVVERDAVLLEVGGSRRLFGGLDALRDSVERAFAAYGWPLRHALAPNPRAAVWLARGRPGAWIESPSRLRGTLGSVPLRALALEPELLERLHGFGLRTLGEVLRLPRAALARRAGAAFCDALRQVLGEAPAPQSGWRAPPRFTASRAFEFEVGSAELLQRALQPLFAELAGVLRRHGCGVRRCTVVFEHRALPSTRVRLGVLDPVRDTTRLETQLALQLERTPLPAPVLGVALQAPRLERVPETARDLFARASGDDWNALVERLGARLGEQALYAVAPHDDHRPECAYRFRRVADGDAAPVARPRQLRPVWLLQAPREVDATRFRFESGPERIESGWWDGDDVVRDYFVARADDGARAWLFRERAAPYRWFLHGLFG